MKPYGFRTENFSGTGIRLTKDILLFEAVENEFNIFSTLIDMDPEIEHFKDAFDMAANDKTRKKVIKDMMEYLKEEVFGEDITYALWLADSIDDVKRYYMPVTIDMYHTSPNVLIDLDSEGTLYAYPKKPKPVKTNISIYPEDDCLVEQHQKAETVRTMAVIGHRDENMVQWAVPERRGYQYDPEDDYTGD